MHATEKSKEVPEGGSEGQVLTRVGADDAMWKDIPAPSPAPSVIDFSALVESSISI